MSSQDNNNNNTNDNSNNFTNMELHEDYIREQSNKRNREEEDDNNEGESSSKRQRQSDGNENDNMLDENISESEHSSESEDSVSDSSPSSETDRINTKYSKRFDAVEDYREKNELLSEMSIQNVMNKLDRGEILSEQEYKTLKRADNLMDQDILKDRDSIQRMILYEEFSDSVQREINDNNARIERHERKISEYHARLDELNQEDNEESSNNNSSNNSEGSSSDNNDDSNNSPGSDNPSDSSGSDGGDNDDRFDDLPPSFDYDDF
jgi:hypothetical protein